jgi:glycosyltransferase involved in cell wall biosynthesis
MAHPCLLAAVGRMPGLRLKVICDRFPVLPGIEVIQNKWSSDTEAQELADTDIGISWLPDHPWSLGKCGLKVLQYMAAGLPVVANPVGIHEKLIRHGQTGFLATSPEAWAEAIQRLADSPKLRRQMGQAARQAVREHYHLEDWSEQWISLLNRLAPPVGRDLEFGIPNSEVGASESCPRQRCVPYSASRVDDLHGSTRP